MNFLRGYLRNRVLRWYCVNITTIERSGLVFLLGEGGIRWFKELGLDSWAFLHKKSCFGHGGCVVEVSVGSTIIGRSEL